MNLGHTRYRVLNKEHSELVQKALFKLEECKGWSRGKNGKNVLDPGISYPYFISLWHNGNLAYGHGHTTNHFKTLKLEDIQKELAARGGDMELEKTRYQIINKAHSKLVQEALFELGCKWTTSFDVISLPCPTHIKVHEDFTMSHGEYHMDYHEHTLEDLQAEIERRKPKFFSWETREEFLDACKHHGPRGRDGYWVTYKLAVNDNEHMVLGMWKEGYKVGGAMVSWDSGDYTFVDGTPIRR